RPAVWMTEATGPTAVDASTSSATDFWSVMSQTTAVHPMSASLSAATAASNRSWLTSQMTTGCSRPTIFAAASPIPPAPPVMTVTSGIEGLQRGAGVQVEERRRIPLRECEADVRTLPGVDERLYPVECGVARQALAPVPAVHSRKASHAACHLVDGH